MQHSSPQEDLEDTAECTTTNSCYSAFCLVSGQVYDTRPDPEGNN